MSNMLTRWRTLKDMYTYAQRITSPRQLVWPPQQLAMPVLVSRQDTVVRNIHGLFSSM